MESFPVQFCKSIRSYWRRKKYHKLDGSSRKGQKIVKLGGGGPKQLQKSPPPSSSWKMRPALKLRLKVMSSPVRLLARLRDAYMDVMLGLAGKSGGHVSGLPAPEAFWARRVPKARSAREGSSKDFDRKLVIEIYKSLAASRGVAI